MHWINKSTSHDKKWGKNGSQGKVGVLLTKRERRILAVIIVAVVFERVKTYSFLKLNSLGTGSLLPWYLYFLVLCIFLRPFYFSFLGGLLLLCLSVSFDFLRVQPFLLLSLVTLNFCIFSTSTPRLMQGVFHSET